MSDVVATNDGIAGTIDRLNQGQSNVYSSFKGDDFDTREKVLDATTNSAPVSEHLGKKINLANIIIQSVEMADDKTGELSEQPRIILIDTDGNSFHAISGGLLRSVENILGILGEPHQWPRPITVVVEEKKGNNGYKFFTMKKA